MCAIIDANVRDQVFGKSRPEAGQYLFDWLNIDSDGVKLVVGGKLFQELSESGEFNRWLRTALRFGRARRIPDNEVNAATKELQEQLSCASDDEHVLALARVSGARLLYTNDRDLQRDFKNRRILSGVQGRVYTTQRTTNVTSTHKNLLRRTNLCGA